MELEEKLKASKVPMIIVHFGEDFETTHTEEYNLENFELSELQIESFARILLPSIREYYKDPKHVQEAAESIQDQRSNKFAERLFVWYNDSCIELCSYTAGNTMATKNQIASTI